MKLPKTSAITSSMYACATLSAEEIPKNGKRKSGDMEVTGMGTASVSHQAKTHTRIANMFLLVTGPSSLTKRHTIMHKRGPRRMYKFLSVRMDEREERKLGFRWIESWMGRSGILRSSEMG
jgi:hypothetical protein